MPSRELQTMSFCTNVIVLAPARTVKGVAVATLLFEERSDENPDRIETTQIVSPFAYGGYSSNSVSPARTVKGRRKVLTALER